MQTDNCLWLLYPFDKIDDQTSQNNDLFLRRSGIEELLQLLRLTWKRSNAKFGMVRLRIIQLLYVITGMRRISIYQVGYIFESMFQDPFEFE